MPINETPSNANGLDAASFAIGLATGLSVAALVSTVAEGGARRQDARTQRQLAQERELATEARFAAIEEAARNGHRSTNRQQRDDTERLFRERLDQLLDHAQLDTGEDAPRVHQLSEPPARALPPTRAPNARIERLKEILTTKEKEPVS